MAGHGTATHVQLRVHDTGSGIPAKHVPQIFEPLYTTKPGGTGLGLYITQQIILAHDGQMTVESATGRGTTFTLTLPRAAATSSVDAALAKHSRLLTAIAPWSRQERAMACWNNRGDQGYRSDGLVRHLRYGAAYLCDVLAL